MAEHVRLPRAVASVAAIVAVLVAHFSERQTIRAAGRFLKGIHGTLLTVPVMFDAELEPAPLAVMPMLT